jgi:hypothetical protein
LKKRKPLNSGGFPKVSTLCLLDDLNYSPRPGVHEHGPIVHDRIAVFANTILRRNIVISDACFRKYGAYPDIAFVAVRGPVFFDDIMTEAGSRIDAQDASDPANDPADGAAHNSADRPCGALAFAGATFHAFRHSLRRCGQWDDYCCS